MIFIRELHVQICLAHIGIVYSWNMHVLVFTDNSNILQLKQRLQLLPLGIGSVGVVYAYISYSPEIAARLIFLLI